jgi:hypothetical protein
VKHLLKALRCRLGFCPGRVVSGAHYPFIWIGWRCADCGKVKHYEPTMYLPRRPGDDRGRARPKTPVPRQPEHV